MKYTNENVIMKPGFEFTPEIQVLLESYDAYYMYIDDGTQYRRAMSENQKIRTQATEMGVVAFGACYAIDYELIKEIPNNFLMEDFYLSMEVFQRFSQK